MTTVGSHSVGLHARRCSQASCKEADVKTNVDMNEEKTKKEPLSKKARKEKASIAQEFCEKKKLRGSDDRRILWRGTA
jgi:hypothetical protein